MQTAHTAIATQLAPKSRRRLTGNLSIPLRHWRPTSEAASADEAAPLVGRPDSISGPLAAAETIKGAGMTIPGGMQISPPAVALPLNQAGQVPELNTQPISPSPVSVAAHAETAHAVVLPLGAPATIPAYAVATRKVSIQAGSSLHRQTVPEIPSALAKADSKKAGSTSPVLAPVERQHSAYMLNEADEDDALLAEAIALHQEQQALAAAAQTGIIALARRSISGLSGRSQGGKAFMRRLCCCF